MHGTSLPKSMHGTNSYSNIQISFSVFSLWQRFPALTSPPPTRQWMEIGVHPKLCVGTVRKALSKLDDTLKSELDGLKKEGKVYCRLSLRIEQWHAPVQMDLWIKNRILEEVTMTFLYRIDKCFLKFYFKCLIETGKTNRPYLSSWQRWRGCRNMQVCLIIEWLKLKVEFENFWLQC